MKFATLALVMAFASPLLASGLDGQSSSGSTLEVRREAAARSLAARRLRRSIESIRESQPLAERDVEARATKKTTTKAKVVALEDIYCGKNDKVCVNKAKKSDVPEGGRVACSTETLRCEARCPYGTTLKNKACVKSESKCGKTTCPKKPSNGSYSCYGGKCSLQCETGFNRNALTPYIGTRCLDLKNDILNCGAEKKVCPVSYNSRGSRTCDNGVCGLDCPAWYSLKYTKAKKLPYCSL